MEKRDPETQRKGPSTDFRVTTSPCDANCSVSSRLGKLGPMPGSNLPSFLPSSFLLLSYPLSSFYKYFFYAYYVPGIATEIKKAKITPLVEVPF